MKNTDKLLHIFEAYDVDISVEINHLFQQVKKCVLPLKKVSNEDNETDIERILSRIDSLEINNVTYKELVELYESCNQYLEQNNNQRIKNPFLENKENIDKITSLGNALCIYKGSEYMLSDVLIDDLSTKEKDSMKSQLFACWELQVNDYMNKTKENIFGHIDRKHLHKNSRQPFKKISIVRRFLVVVFLVIVGYLIFNQMRLYGFNVPAKLYSIMFVILVVRLFLMKKISSYHKYHMRKINGYYLKIQRSVVLNLKQIKRDYKTFDCSKVELVREKIREFSKFYLYGTTTKFYTVYQKKRKHLKNNFFVFVIASIITIFYLFS